MAEIYNQSIRPGSEVWLPSQETVWTLGTVLAITEEMVR